ncbi:MAG: alpha/beta hydrolase, partial [Frankia sp.]|nr:alpha/beta hydrolase [Frankia sp.]
MAGSKAARATGGGLGLVSAVVAAGLLAERRATRRARARQDVPEELRPGPVTGQPVTVLASDGVPLHVIESGAGTPGPTLVFVHGFCVTADSWCFQQRALADLGPMVFYDQRAHGRSGPSEVARCTIDQLADDLYAVLAARVPTGPVVLVGHSMGGMTILGLAERHPELFDERVVGVALLSTSAGDLARVTFGLPAGVTAAVRRVLPKLAVGMRLTPPLLERARRRGSDLAYSITRRVGFGNTDIPPSVVTFLEGMIASTPIPVIASFLPTLLEHDKLAAASVLRNVPTVLMVGTHDLMTPLPHSRTLAEALPEAELVVEEGAGHGLPLERPDAVNDAIRALARRAHPASRARRIPPP